MHSLPKLLQETNLEVLIGILQRIQRLLLHHGPENRLFLAVRLGRGPIQLRLLLLQQKLVAFQAP